jgi:WD40 repeat protein
LYALPEAQLLTALEANAGAARALAFSADGRTLASGGEDRAVTLWHVATGQQLFALPGIEAQVNGLAFASDGRSLAAATHDGKVTFWKAVSDADDFGPVPSFSRPTKGIEETKISRDVDSRGG